jgi:hypothetical protein
VAEDRGELDADHAAAQDHQPLGHLSICRAGPVESTHARPSIPSTGGRSECEPVAIDGRAEADVLPASTAIVFGPVNARGRHDRDAVGLDDAGDAVDQPATMACLVRLGWPEVELRRPAR